MLTRFPHFRPSSALLSSPCLSDLLILDFERRKWNLKKLGQKIADMQSKYRLLLLEQVKESCPIFLAESLRCQSMFWTRAALIFYREEYQLCQTEVLPHTRFSTKCANGQRFPPFHEFTATSCTWYIYHSEWKRKERWNTNMNTKYSLHFRPGWHLPFLRLR